MSQDGNERIRNAIGRQIYSFQSLVETLHQKWPDQRGFVDEQLRRYSDVVQQIVETACDTRDGLVGSCDTNFWEAPVTDTAGSDGHNVSPLRGNRTSSPRPLSHDANLGLFGEWTRDEMFSGDLNSTASGTVNASSLHAAVQLEAPHAIISDGDHRLVNCEENRVRGHLPETINPAWLCKQTAPGFMSPVGETSTPQNEPFAMSPTVHRVRAPGDGNSNGPQRTPRRLYDLATSCATPTLAPREREPMEDKAELLPALYKSIASPENLVRQARILASIRESPLLEMQCSTISPALICRLLDRVELMQQSYGMWRRLLLYRFSELQGQILTTVSDQRRAGATQSRLLRLGRAESETRDILTEKLYPHTASQGGRERVRAWRNRFAKERKSIANRLHAARNWWRAARRFSLGIFAVIPFGGDFRTQSYGYETLKDRDCESFLDELEKKDNGYVATCAANWLPLVKALYQGEAYPPASSQELIAAPLGEVQRVDGWN